MRNNGTHHPSQTPIIHSSHKPAELWLGLLWTPCELCPHGGVGAAACKMGYGTRGGGKAANIPVLLSIHLVPLSGMRLPQKCS